MNKQNKKTKHLCYNISDSEGSLCVKKNSNDTNCKFAVDWR